MTGYELIKFYDFEVPVDALTAMPTTPLGEPLTTIDETLSATLKRALALHSQAFPTLTRNWTRGVDIGSIVIDNPGYRIADNVNSPGHSVAILFTGNTRYIEFPLQGITIESRPGRVVMFPGDWTHPYSIFGEGHYYQSDIVLTNQSWKDCEVSNLTVDNLRHDITII